MNTRQTVILSKTESTYGTDAAPTVAANAIRCGGIEITPEVEMLPRKYYDPTFGSEPSVPGMESISFDITEVELKGSGTAGEVPEIDPLLKCAGVSCAISAGTSVTYKPATDSDSLSATIWGYKDTILHKGTGCYAASAVLKYEAGKFPTVDFTGIKGQTVAETEATPSTPTFNETKPVAAVNTTFTLDSYAHIVRTVEITIPNELFTETSMNATKGVEGTRITGREIAVKITGAFPALSTKDMWGAYKAGTEHALSLVVGTTAGNIQTVTAPKIVIQKLSYVDNGGKIDFSLDGICHKNVGDDELQIVFT